MKAVLIDDELNNLNNLRALLETYCPQIEVCSIAQSAEQGKAALYMHQPDLLFLDIQMPDQDGFSLLSSLTKYDFEVIFVTAYDQYAIQAMRFSAIDYLLKPVNIIELQAAVARAQKQRQLKVENKQVAHLMQWIEAQSRKEELQIALSTTQETRLVKTNEIIRCESSNNYTTFFLNDKTNLLVSKPIYEYDELLSDYGFLRCHQSHLVNQSFIRSWQKEYGDFLLLIDGTQVPISRGKREVVKKALRL
ncbi:LytTR family DNA-binding domain-containing protein [Emticicia sp. C21]|uniref:LytR/AlgR family response regulator transcription factor n=1 Tax=Emticicia sp. C21 TaxID=2302915 RepID=UPI000E34F7C8|nr:LytTR family DNA-binding domain-containing protein [Emticicia sp. C21]RFS14191.1 DNA-binding response regulator [Emticicia sp. C21]